MGCSETPLPVPIELLAKMFCPLSYQFYLAFFFDYTEFDGIGNMGTLVLIKLICSLGRGFGL